ncbi:sulfate/molybdate ABC transporter ATP-binding protein [Flavitalea flava]
MNAPNPFLQFRAFKMLHTAQGNVPLDISFELEKGKLLTIYGNSGAGKTTILRIIAGLTDMEKGWVMVDGETWFIKGNNPGENKIKNYKINQAPRRRSIGLVFQDFALFPHLTVKEQLEFALQKGDDKKIVSELMDMMELAPLQDKLPALLSGGQQQRVALARAIARKPKLLLLDEPLSALDDEMRFKLQDYILKVHRHFNLTTILVSHYLPEIFRLSDEVIVLEKGKIMKKGNPSAIFAEEKISGKFKVTGEIIDIVKADIVYIVSVLCANSIVKVIATKDEIDGLRTGQKVMVASKAFNPIIIKMS